MFLSINNLKDLYFVIADQVYFDKALFFLYNRDEPPSETALLKKFKKMLLELQM